MKKIIKPVLLFLIVLVCCSCRREDIRINRILSQPYMKMNGEMGLSVYLSTTLTNYDKTTVIITDPSGTFSWTVPINEAEFQGSKYYGSSDIGLPNGFPLPKGEWKVELFYKDGRTITDTFTVEYSDFNTAAEKYSVVDSAVFDTETNLTILP